MFRDSFMHSSRFMGRYPVSSIMSTLGETNWISALSTRFSILARVSRVTIDCNSKKEGTLRRRHKRPDKKSTLPSLPGQTIEKRQILLNVDVGEHGNPAIIKGRVFFDYLDR